MGGDEGEGKAEGETAKKKALPKIDYDIDDTIEDEDILMPGLDDSDNDMSSSVQFIATADAEDWALISNPSLLLPNAPPRFEESKPQLLFARGS